MGMFDKIICDYPLPDLEVQNHHFQTKSFDCNLDIFKITKDGKFKIEKAYSPLLNEGDYIKTDFKFNMYTSLGSHAKKNFVWYEYDIEFKDGKLISIKRFTDGFI